MKFCLQKSTLLENIIIVQKAVSGKSTVPILEGVYIKAKNNNIKLLANDLKIAIETNAQIEIIEEGEIVLNAKLLYEIVSKLPDGEVLIESDENFKTIIKCQKSKFEIYGLNPEDFPSVEFVESDIKIGIDKSKLKNIIRQTIFSIGQDEKKMVLTGALFDIDNDILKVVSLDGYRLSYRKLSIENTLITKSFIIPGKTLNELLKILNDDENIVEFCFTGNRVTVKADSFILYSNLIDGEFFNYEHIIPTQCDLTVKTNTKEIIDSIIRASLIITPDAKSPLKFEITKDQIYMTSSSKNGNAEDTLNCETNGCDLSIGFNHKYLLDALKACESKECKIEFTSSLNPMVIKPVENDDYIYLILPLRLRNE